ncbi:phosphoserine transaminase [Temperatibacter marinus]|uniref:phosphoserine transaminase n=1 Tax=Temperatibacter marinus TaxID=1456591 RepID=A0AA52HAV3_9PROT|nr:phosphoserine transaminase [Temperatibacter marinus]WND03125.1 phosphoserine transaminase [Temperatibacter marinus]
MTDSTLQATKPVVKPLRPEFSSGPCAKRPGWDLTNFSTATLGRSHRSSVGKERLQYALTKSHELLGLPEDYVIGLVPGSDTGAVEMALWSMLGERGVDMLAWESFGSGWVTDVVKQLKLDDVNIYEAEYGEIPDLSKVNTDRDVVFTWNGTTSGAMVPNADWICENRKGLTICDATSAAFAMDLPWDKLDVVTYSWQKVLGSEGAHGMIILSPRAVKRLENFDAGRALPKIFRLTKAGKLISGIFKGATINTPSMLALEDYIDALEWAEANGGLQFLIERSQDSLAVIEDWIEDSDWAAFLVADKALRSHTSVCLKIKDAWISTLDADVAASVPKKLSALLDAEDVAYDINGYRDAPAGLRIWCGSTVDSADVEALLPWLDWAYTTVKAELSS